MSDLERVQRAATALKVFPLPSVVLFPGMALPLHIFEERYRTMVRDALRGDKVLAMVQPEPGWETNEAEQQALRPMGCAGMIVWHQELADRRYNIILKGLARVRILEEVPSPRLYREVRAQVLPDLPYSGPEEGRLRQAVFELATHVPTELTTGLLQSVARTKGGELADIVASAVVSDVDRRQDLLCELSVKDRLVDVITDLGELIARLGPARPAGPVN